MKIQVTLHVVGFVIALAIFLLVASERRASAFAQSSAGAEDLQAIYNQDQNDRSNITAASIQRDTQRRELVHKLLNDGKVQTGEDYYHAAVVYQHGQTPRDYLLAHVLATTSVAKGYKDGLWLQAATLDRYLQSIKQPQIFGTQFRQYDDNPYSQEPYDANLVSDSLRAASCVAPYSAQLENLRAVNSGKGFHSTQACQ